MGDFTEFDDGRATGGYCPPGGRAFYACEMAYVLLEKPLGFQRDESCQKHYLLEKLGISNLLGERET